MVPVEVRRNIAAAIGSDDWLMEQMVLKGGSALEIVHKIGGRSSLDLDYSMESAIVEFARFRDRLLAALERRFSLHGLEVLDFRFEPRPSHPSDPRFVGYQCEFKLVAMAHRSRFAGDQDALRRNAIVSGNKQQRIYSIQISANEYCSERIEVTVENTPCYVYPSWMIAIEKLRAICQQMPDYPYRRYPTPRARDFYDITRICQETGLWFGSARARELVVRVFHVKAVSLELIKSMEGTRGFHFAAWPQVVGSVAEQLQPFDSYFDFVIERTQLLEPLWNPDAPICVEDR